METRNVKILVVDDEDGIREGLCEYLRLEGYEADGAASAEEALAKGIGGYGLLLLDVMMDGMDGFELAPRLKQNPDTAGIPIIFLTAKDTDDDMVAGLKLGADDYIPKPFSMKNVMARIEAVTRRSLRNSKVSENVVCDRVTVSCGAPAPDNPGRIFTREELMKRIWPDNVVVVDRSVDVHITRIRSKIAPYGKHIVSRSGYGYGWQD